MLVDEGADVERCSFGLGSNDLELGGRNIEKAWVPRQRVVAEERRVLQVFSLKKGWLPLHHRLRDSVPD